MEGGKEIEGGGGDGVKSKDRGREGDRGRGKME